MIAEITQDLINKLLTVTEFQGRVGAQVGGTSTDATMVDAPIPYAWVVFANSSPLGNEGSHGRNYLQVEYNFTVIVVIDYAEMDDNDFIGTKLLILDKCVEAVHAAPSIDNFDKWQFSGADLFKTYPNSMVYQLGFSAVGYLQIT